jgi:hypothetical protein
MKNFRGDCNWFYGCNCNWYCNCNYDYNLGFYEETLIFQTSSFQNLIQGIDAGELVGADEISKIQLLPPQT